MGGKLANVHLINCQTSAAKIIVDAQHTFAEPAMMALEVYDMCKETASKLFEAYGQTQEVGEAQLKKPRMNFILSEIYKNLINY